ncbi:MAG: acyl-CoA/acyl-ACP dehydrogenase [Streptosporangiaceae bacterium]|nr:acyl-CoA/acyl-ACP dehydrogenase [Streptosporangiaceae bacterium]MBV9855447.1 acyl-CoA/acyl-ACP dehydrogenase [Streptosporangiaceae bacterium]
MTDGKEELGELREAVRDFLAAKSPESAVRAATETGQGYDPAVWDQMARQLRLPGLALPGDYGGDGFGLTELGVVLEEMGAALLCSPFFATAVLAAQALLASADEEACARYLPGLAAGQTIATLAAAEGSASWDPALIVTRAERSAEGWALSGKKSFVIDGAAADLILVVARGTAGPTLFAVNRGAPGLRAEPMTTLDPTRPMATLTFDRAPAVLVGAEGQGGRLMSQVLDVACVALAAEQAGGARRCLEMSAGYARTRFQFGRPIGSFQAVKHKCADMLVRVELAEATAREAARLADEAAADFPVAAATAHVCCSRAYMFAAAENIQVHGGIGFTWEHPAHLYFRRAKSSELLFGGPAVYHERLLDRLGI